MVVPVVLVATGTLAAVVAMLAALEVVELAHHQPPAHNGRGDTTIAVAVGSWNAVACMYI